MWADLFKFMATMYPQVIPVAFFKLIDINGEVFRTGYDFRSIEAFQDLVDNEQEWRQRFLDMCHRQWGDQAILRIGRPLSLDDIRIAFRPNCETYLMAFVDDVEPMAKAHLLVETSPGNWQAHFVLSRPCTSDEVLMVHRYLSQLYNGDQGAHAADQARRLPRPPLRTTVQQPAMLDVDQILQQTKPPATRLPKKSKQFMAFSQQTFHEMWSRKLKQAHGDKSRADFKMAIYLLSKGYSVEEICDVLNIVSSDLEQRKGRWSNDYLLRTVIKAQQLLYDE